MNDFTRVGTPARLRRLPYRIETRGESVKAAKKTAKQQPATSVDDFNAFVKKHCPLGGSALLIHQVPETDDNGQARWTFTHCGDAGALQLMAAHAMAMMATRYERKRAEILRGGR